MTAEVAIPGNAATARYAAKKEAILAAATTILNRQGVKGMTLADVAAEVGLITTSVTYYYRTGTGGAMSNMKGLEQGYLALLTELGTLPRVDWADLVRSRMRVARILALSWCARGEWPRGLLAGCRAICR